MKKFTLLCTTLLLVVIALNTTFTHGLMNWFNTPAVTRAEISGKDGELVVTAANTIVNKYAILAANAAVGSAQISVTNPGGPNGLDPNTLEAGDLIMIIQMSGASIDTSNTVNFGNVTDLKNAGRHEFITVNQVQGNTITLNPPCGGLKFSYVVSGSESGKVQVIRVPQYTKLTINSGASLTAPKWNGSVGGIVVVDVQNDAIINGNINVTGLGFRGGELSNVSVATFGRVDYATVQQNDGAQKGESIVGFQTDYDPLGGRFGRGAPANGGGGGTSHNSGGGGGANASNGKTWTGQGVMANTGAGSSAWMLDPGYIANGNALTDSSGGGRGGYGYSTNLANPLTQGPGNIAWGGDLRREVGGLGGRPVAQDTSSRLFFGGGGGAGHQNNDAGGKGGDGGGLIYIIAETVTGSGTLLANGSDGGGTRNTHQDGAGGGGGGGTIVVAAKSSLSGISAIANGGNGGIQLNPVSFPTESEGAGGGGGGGFIAFRNGTMTAQADGGANGTSQAPVVSSFPANGATRGASGFIVNTIASIPFCSTTADLTITKTDNSATAVPGVPLTYVIVARNNGPNDVFGIPVVDNLPPTLINASWTCTPSVGSACSVANGTGSINTTVSLLNGGTATFNLTVTPDPSATGTITNAATIMMPGGAVDTNPTNDTASDTNTLTPQADLSITKTDGVTTVTAGTALTYTITVRNSGPSTVIGATVTDNVPVKLTNVLWTCTATAGGSCASPSGGGSINTTVNLLPGSVATFKVNATVVSSASGSLINTATVASSATVPDTAPNNNSDTDTDTISASGDLAITKTNNATVLVPGAQTTYTIAASNNGPSAISGAMVADNLPATLTNATWTCTASSGSSCGSANGAGSINATIDLAVGGTATFTLTAQVAPNASGTLSNTASIAAPPGITDPDSANNTATDTDNLAPAADLRITKTNGVNTLAPGSQTVYSIVVTNDGPSAVASATVTDNLAAILTNAIWTCTATAGSSCGAPSGGGNISTSVNLQSGGSATITVTATVASTALGTLVNTATVAAPGGITDPNPSNNSATDSDTLAPSADLGITKTNPVATPAPGSQTTYTIVVTNNGPSVVTDATVTDNLPVSLTNAIWTCTASAGSSCGTTSGGGDISASVNLLSGGSATFTVTATISSTAFGTLVNTATVAAPGGVTDPNPANNSATDVRSLGPSADLSITKSNGATTVVPGTQTTYTLVISNAGPSAVTNAGVSDILPATLSMISWTCTASAGSSCGAPSGNVNLNNTPVSLAVGGTATIALTVTVSAQATGTVSNSASVAAPNGTIDPNSANNSAIDTDTLTVTADLAITKTDNATTVTAGNQITYTITATNSGPSMITDASVVDTLPATLTNATWTCTASPGASCGSASGSGSINAKVSLAGNTTATFTLTATIANNATGTLSNTATISAPAGVTDPTAGNNSATDTNSVVSLSDLRIAKTVNPQQPVPGSPLTYTIVVTNDGPSPANGATVTDNVPNILTNVNWTCTASSGSSCGSANGTGSISATVNLAVSGTATFTVTANVPAGANATIVNTASVAAPGGTTDPNSGNNSATVTSTVQPSTDLSITKTADSTSVRAGDEVTYTITARNNGPSDATAVVMTDPLPSGITFVSVTSTKGTCSGTTTVTCNLGTLTAAAPDNVAVITVRILVPFTFPAGPLTNIASVSGPANDPAGGNNTGTSTVTVTAPPGALFKPADLVIRTNGSDVCIGGGNVLNVEAKIRNTGSGAQFDNPGPEFLALLPTALTTIPGTCTSSISSGGSGVCTLGTSQIEWSGAVPVGATVTITYQVRVRQNIEVGARFCTDYKVNYDTNSDGINDAQTIVNDCLTANCTPPPCTGSDCPDIGPGAIQLPFASSATGSDQRPGSVLIFPIYSSDAANPSLQNTRLNFTNTHTLRPAYLHLFFLDGSSCAVADNFLCLTPNQTTSFQISDLDPGVTGYVIAVAVDSRGCPTNFNYLIGDEYIKFSSGHSANLGAEAYSALFVTTDANGNPITPVDPFVCSASANTARLIFDNTVPNQPIDSERHYNRLGRVLAASNIPSRADGNDTMLIVNRIGGELGLGATTLGSLFGIFYDDSEAAVSFTFSAGGCQFRSSITNNFPRITPRFESFVPAGRSSWLKVGLANEGGLVGATINANPNSNGFRGGHNLHKLTLNPAVTLTMPVFPPSCQ